MFKSKKANGQINYSKLKFCSATNKELFRLGNHKEVRYKHDTFANYWGLTGP